MTQAIDASAGRRGLLRVAALLLFFALAAGLVLEWTGGIQRAWQIAARYPWEIVLLAASLQALRFLATGRIASSAARIGGAALPLLAAAEIVLASASAGLVLAGAALTIPTAFRWLRQSGVEPGAASLASWLPTTLDNAAMLLLAIVGAAFFTITFRATPSVALGSLVTLILLVACVLLAVVAVRFRARAAKLLARVTQRIARLVGRTIDASVMEASVRRALDAAAELRGGRWCAPFGWGLLGVIFDAASLYVLFRAAGLAIDPLVLLAGFSVPQLLGRVSPIPGGVGFIEASMVATWHAFGIPTPEVAAVVLTYRLISLWLPHLLGFGLVLHLEARAPGPR